MRKLTQNLALRWIGYRCWRKQAAVQEAVPLHCLAMGSTGQSSATGVAPAVFAPSYLEIKGWCGFRDRNTHGLTEAQAREIITKLRQGIGLDLDSLIARVGAMRVRNTKIICYLTTPSLSSCKQIREEMNAFIEKENIKLGPQGTTPFVTEEKPAWR